jgi:hypothetical protein
MHSAENVCSFRAGAGPEEKTEKGDRRLSNYAHELRIHRFEGRL